MRIIFVGTSAWYAVQDKGDANHNIAAIFVKESMARKYRMVTTNYILDETYTLILERIGYKFAVQFKHIVDIMLNSHTLTIIRISESMEESAWEVFEQFNVDKKWSFTDCTSKVVMEERRIDEVFAFDGDFKQMGFIRKP